VRYQISHPYKTRGKIIALYILNVMLLDSRWDDKIFPEFNLLFIPS
jgi:hypothetical protein